MAPDGMARGNARRQFRAPRPRTATLPGSTPLTTTPPAHTVRHRWRHRRVGGPCVRGTDVDAGMEDSWAHRAQRVLRRGHRALPEPDREVQPHAAHVRRGRHLGRRSSRPRRAEPIGARRRRPRAAARHSHVGEVPRPRRRSTVTPSSRSPWYAIRRHLRGAPPPGGGGHRRHEHDDGSGQHGRRRSRQSGRVQAVQLGRRGAQPMGHRAGTGMVELRRRRPATAGLLPFSIGSDGGGSTRLPTAYSGVVGLHTTRGLVPHLDYEKPTMMLTTSYGPLRPQRARRRHRHAHHRRPRRADYVCIQTDTPDCVASLDAGVDGMRLAWTERLRFRVALPRRKERRHRRASTRDAALGLKGLGATVETTDEVSGRPRRAGHGRLDRRTFCVRGDGRHQPGTPLQAVDADLYHGGPGTRARNWEKFRTLFRDHNTILSVTAQIVAPTIEWSGHGLDHRRSHVPGRKLRARLLQPHDDVQLAGLPHGISAVRLRRRPPRRAADRGVARAAKTTVLRIANAFQQAFPTTSVRR